MKNTQTNQIRRYSFDNQRITNDIVAIEEPLEITIGYGSAQRRQYKTIAVTMRTPLHDTELALGFLFTEGVIFSKKDVGNVRILEENRLLVDLTENTRFDVGKLNRHFYTTSSCGVCGKASLDAVSTQTCFLQIPDAPVISPQILRKIATQSLDNQSLFKETGGVHASVLFDTEGGIVQVFEDVGRHNALDKLIGWAFQRDLLPLSKNLLWVSGRASFELIQKASMAGLPIVAAVGAPSSLAVNLADEQGLTLIGFLKEKGFNVYTGFQRIA
jgi:FdhD protein